MADKRRFIDVWITELNTVYREVPFTVVIDWIQQGRLLEDDQVKPSGTPHWVRIADASDFAPFLPHPEPHRANDQAEALEPVALNFSYRRPHRDEDEDVDMIPLIDVSLVLLVFFMLTATTVGTGIFIATPATYNSDAVLSPTALWVGIDLPGEGEPLVFSFGEGSRLIAGNLQSREELIDRHQEHLNSKQGRFEITIHGHRDAPSGVIGDLTVLLGTGTLREKIQSVHYGVTDKIP